jgi:uncharacterized repeat protein (TIGR03806 family)
MKFLLSFLPALMLMWMSGFTGQEISLSPLPPMNLSEYGFFEGKMADLQPAADVVPYSLNTPLFSDYAWKSRFVRLPAGTHVAYQGEKVFDFPVGTALIKTFYYPHDFRQPDKGRTLMETRVLIREEKGWKALPYVWNEAQTDAVLEVAGDHRDIAWKDINGKKQKLSYAVPNMNQCKSCHNVEGEINPIGPAARQLNGDLAYAEGTENQLRHWQARGLLHGLPDDFASVPRAAVWNDPSTGSVEDRARIWLDINCAHCHNPQGPASTSGFFLDVHQTDPGVLGVRKSPVAAGRGAGGNDYDILPGKPDESILVYRLAATDPGVMMPEIGRKIVDVEGLALIRAWIEEMK